MEQDKIKFYKALTVLVVLGAVFVFTKVVTEVKSYRFIGGGVSATNTISISGEGEVFAVPDIANISFTIREDAKKVSAAQDEVTKKVKTALASVRKLGVEEKDIKTQNYSSYPKYEWQKEQRPCPTLYDDCALFQQGKQVIVGYTVSQTVIIKVRNLEIVSAVIDGLATSGVSETQGPNFSIDKEDDLKAEARKQAIDKARTKAEVLAKDLGVSLIRVVSFSEGGGGYYRYAVPMNARMETSMDADALPEIPQGEQKITSSVTVTYEIR